MQIAFDIRPATLDDVAVLAETMRLGFEGYRAFAPRGWDPPAPGFEQARIADRLPLPDAWCRIAEAAGEPAGHVAILAAREQTGDRSGLASRLHGLAVEEAAARGYDAMQLFTPAGQARARRLHERQGWTSNGVETFEPMIGLDLVTYRRAF